MPYLDSNIPSKCFLLSELREEILRSAKTTNDAAILERSSTILINQMMKIEGKINRLSTTLNRSFGLHFNVFRNYNTTSLELVQSFLN